MEGSNMEDMYVKPGNQERGWNDPPQFSYGLQKAHGPQRNLLSRRAAPPAAPGSGAPPMAPPSSSPLALPPKGSAPPPLNPAGPPPLCVATPPPPSGPVRNQKEADSSQSESEPDVEAVLSVLNGALAACRGAVKEQVCNDVAKRLRLLEDSWRAGRLSLPVRRRMDCLSKELQAGRWDSADDFHRSLMVDHVTEVSQWMVGVKRLIAEARNLSPDRLQGFVKSGEPGEPEGPEGLGEPERPGEPEGPGEPERPGEPEGPGEPERPGEPGEPKQVTEEPENPGLDSEGAEQDPVCES